MSRLVPRLRLVRDAYAHGLTHESECSKPISGSCSCGADAMLQELNALCSEFETSLTKALGLARDANDAVLMLKSRGGAQEPLRELVQLLYRTAGGEQ